MSPFHPLGPVFPLLRTRVPLIWTPTPRLHWDRRYRGKFVALDPCAPPTQSREPLSSTQISVPIPSTRTRVPLIRTPAPLYRWVRRNQEISVATDTRAIFIQTHVPRFHWARLNREKIEALDSCTPPLRPVCPFNSDPGAPGLFHIEISRVKYGEIAREFVRVDRGGWEQGSKEPIVWR
ncbi:hypothetical protein Y032_0001g432 [Ancylostoma ceylanicum]|uniref:Uncharacterized protein n=1 Tax=Ancylostoma ceylanicum TaxID=53326 RepID=A0A016W4G1_9BILA|nr:hypothetical protein Y032_0001g432 [Ancylostoma ceylanicum]